MVAHPHLVNALFGGNLPGVLERLDPGQQEQLLWHVRGLLDLVVRPALSASTLGELLARVAAVQTEVTEAKRVCLDALEGDGFAEGSTLEGSTRLARARDLHARAARRLARVSSIASNVRRIAAVRSYADFMRLVQRIGELDTLVMIAAYGEAPTEASAEGLLDALLDHVVALGEALTAEVDALTAEIAAMRTTPLEDLLALQPSDRPRVDDADLRLASGLPTTR